MFGDQGADALDRSQQAIEGLTCHDSILPVLLETPGSLSFLEPGALL
jgi:hypothetical protein